MKNFFARSNVSNSKNVVSGNTQATTNANVLCSNHNQVHRVPNRRHACICYSSTGVTVNFDGPVLGESRISGRVRNE